MVLIYLSFEGQDHHGHSVLFRYSKRVSFWMGRYEDFVGLTEVKAAQEKVVRAEREFSREQEKRREAQLQIREVQEKVKEIHAELEKTYRGEDKYLTLITQVFQNVKFYFSGENIKRKRNIAFQSFNFNFSFL